ncbi:MAG: SDR family oxidoreductase [Rhodospirillales bacterium]|nr:SDR family oxidoreductase [Rhodospirillales bacterium]
MQDSLQGKRVVITAGGSGLGRVMAEAFLAAGARVHVCDVDVAALDETHGANPGVGTTVADVAEPEQVAHLFSEAEADLGGLDVMINNAGIAGPTGALEQIAPEDWRRTIAVDLDGVFYCLRHAVPLLKQAGGGSIVNISSTAGLFGFPLRAPYAAAKWAVIGLTKTLAMELGPCGIRVNAICPGSIEGPRIDRVIAAAAEARGVSAREQRDFYLRQSSLRCFVTAEDIANMALFLASDAGSKISGQALAVDGHTEFLSN